MSQSPAFRFTESKMLYHSNYKAPALHEIRDLYSRAVRPRPSPPFVLQSRHIHMCMLERGGTEVDSFMGTAVGGEWGEKELYVCTRVAKK